MTKTAVKPAAAKTEQVEKEQVEKPVPTRPESKTHYKLPDGSYAVWLSPTEWDILYKQQEKKSALSSNIIGMNVGIFAACFALLPINWAAALLAFVATVFAVVFAGEAGREKFRKLAGVVQPKPKDEKPWYVKWAARLFVYVVLYAGTFVIAPLGLAYNMMPDAPKVVAMLVLYYAAIALGYIAATEQHKAFERIQAPVYKKFGTYPGEVEEHFELRMDDKGYERVPMDESPFLLNLVSQDIKTDVAADIKTDIKAE